MSSMMSSTLTYQDLYPFRYQNGNEISSNLFIILIIISIYCSYNGFINILKNYVVSDINSSDNSKKHHSFVKLIVKEVERLFGAVGFIILFWSLLEFVGVFGWVEYFIDEDVTSTSVDNIESIAKASGNNIVDISIKKQIEQDQPIQIHKLLLSSRFTRLLGIVVLSIIAYKLQIIYFTSSSIKSIHNSISNGGNIKQKLEKQQQYISIYKKDILNEHNYIIESLLDIPWLAVSIVVGLCWLSVRTYLQNVPIHSLSKPMSMYDINYIIDLLSLGSHFSLFIIYYFLYQTLCYSTMPSSFFKSPISSPLLYNSNANIDDNEDISDSIGHDQRQQEEFEQQQQQEQDQDQDHEQELDEVLSKKKKKKKVKQGQMQQKQLDGAENIKPKSKSKADLYSVRRSSYDKAINFDQEGLLFIIQLIIVFQSIYLLFIVHRVISEPFTSIATKLLILISHLISTHYLQTNIFSNLPVCFFLTNITKTTEKNK